MQLTERDKAIFIFMQNNGGKTFEKVLAKTFFTSEYSCHNRVSCMIKERILKRVLTGVATPRSMLVFGDEIKEWFKKEIGEEPKNASISRTLIEHEMLQQIAYYWLSQIYDVFRTTPKNWDEKTKGHRPDLFITTSNKSVIYVELERTQKTTERYKKLITELSYRTINMVLYVFPKESDVNKYMNLLPRWSKLSFISLEQLISNIKTTNKIGAQKQDEKLGGIFSETNQG